MLKDNTRWCVCVLGRCRHWRHWCGGGHKRRGRQQRQPLRGVGRDLSGGAVDMRGGVCGGAHVTAAGRGWVMGWTVGNRCRGRGEADCGSRDHTGHPGLGGVV